VTDWVEGTNEKQEFETVGSFDTQVAVSDNREYKVYEAERKDLAYLVKNSCISCNRLMKESEIKIVPPRYVQERDHYVNSGAVDKRLMCVSCYNTLKSITRSKIKYRDSSSSRKSFIVKSVINNLLLKH